ncbi:hypothetical protein [Kordia sp.]|uniref:hypothetical protein n=1 Tax=Kordia sp. TaxID=1965332 RepID=UPI003D6B4F9E
MRSDVTEATELFSARVFVRFKDFHVKANLTANTLSEIQKNEWETFLQLYSIMGMIT